MLGIGGCKNDSSIGYIYAHDDVKYRIAISDAKKNYPDYFSALSESGAEKYFRGRQIFGKDVECVAFENSSSIIIEINLPIYCFKKGTDVLTLKL
jgi:hypothetical protein